MHKESLPFSYVPTLDPRIVDARLQSLVKSGTVAGKDLERRIARLENRFQVYSRSYIYGLWAPGLVVTNEMRRSTEALMPLVEIQLAVERLFALTLNFPANYRSSVLHSSADWLEVLDKFASLIRKVNPAALLRSLLSDEAERIRFTFANFLPRHFGGQFNRYPEQRAFLKDWLIRRKLSQNTLRCLDAACGSGEGTYDLVGLLLGNEYRVNNILVHGSSLEPLELFAAAHGYFPHDPFRQNIFRGRMESLENSGALNRMAFFQEDLLESPTGQVTKYDVILCNGFLGGPLLHDEAGLHKTITNLVSKLKMGGILLIDDNFHAGWKKSVSELMMQMILKQEDINLCRIKKGFAAEKRKG